MADPEHAQGLRIASGLEMPREELEDMARETEDEIRAWLRDEEHWWMEDRVGLTSFYDKYFRNWAVHFHTSFVTTVL